MDILYKGVVQNSEVSSKRSTAVVIMCVNSANQADSLITDVAVGLEK